MVLSKSSKRRILHVIGIAKFLCSVLTISQIKNIKMKKKTKEIEKKERNGEKKTKQKSHETSNICHELRVSIENTSQKKWKCTKSI